MKIPLLKFRHLLKDCNLRVVDTSISKFIYNVPADTDTYVVLYKIINDKRLLVGLSKDLNISYASLDTIVSFDRLAGVFTKTI